MEKPHFSPISETIVPQQIVCLENGWELLYGEVIQMIQPRNHCWLRPLLLARHADTTNPDPQGHQLLLDLRHTSDLIIPAHWLRQALDSELFPLYGQLPPPNPSPESISSARQTLRRIVEERTHHG